MVLGAVYWAIYFVRTHKCIRSSLCALIIIIQISTLSDQCSVVVKQYVVQFVLLLEADNVQYSILYQSCEGLVYNFMHYVVVLC